MVVKNKINTIMFDVFGTIFDWHSSIVNECSFFAQQNNVSFDHVKFTNDWRSGFRKLQKQVSGGVREYLSMDAIHLEVLNILLSDFNILGIAEKEKVRFNQSWHRLIPWEDVKPGLYDLKRHHVITTLSNGNYSMLLNLAKNSHLPWDCILSTELFGTYKPDPRVYIGAIGLLGCEPEQTLMVASHGYDLDAAKSVGIKTCYVYRPDEFGIGKSEDSGDTGRFDLVVDSFTEITGSIL